MTVHYTVWSCMLLAHWSVLHILTYIIQKETTADRKMLQYITWPYAMSFSKHSYIFKKHFHQCSSFHVTTWTITKAHSTVKKSCQPPTICLCFQLYFQNWLVQFKYSTSSLKKNMFHIMGFTPLSYQPAVRSNCNYTKQCSILLPPVYGVCRHPAVYHYHRNRIIQTQQDKDHLVCYTAGAIHLSHLHSCVVHWCCTQIYIRFAIASVVCDTALTRWVIVPLHWSEHNICRRDTAQKYIFPLLGNTVQGIVVTLTTVHYNSDFAEELCLILV